MRGTPQYPGPPLPEAIPGVTERSGTLLDALDRVVRRVPAGVLSAPRDLSADRKALRRARPAGSPRSGAITGSPGQMRVCTYLSAARASSIRLRWNSPGISGTPPRGVQAAAGPLPCRGAGAPRGAGIRIEAAGRLSGRGGEGPEHSLPGAKRPRRNYLSPPFIFTPDETIFCRCSRAGSEGRVSGARLQRDV